MGVEQKMEMRELELIEINDNADTDINVDNRQVQRKKKNHGKRKKRRRRRRRMIRLFLYLSVFAAVIGLGGMFFLLADAWLGNIKKKDAQQAMHEQTGIEEIMPGNAEWRKFYETELERPPLDVQLLTVNEYSRPGDELPEVKNIFVHYTANAGTTAAQNRSYFESLAETKERSASAHFIIGIDGEIVQCIPTKEIAYAVMKRNFDSISVECCYLDESGKFTPETYQSLIELTAWLLHKYRLSPEEVLRHYDAGGKNCPKYYVENEDAWRQFLSDLATYMTEVSEDDDILL